MLVGGTSQTAKPKQDRQADKAGGLTRQGGSIDVPPALTADIFAAATNKTRQAGGTLSSLPTLDVYELNLQTKLNTQGFSYVAIAQCPL